MKNLIALSLLGLTLASCGEGKKQDSAAETTPEYTPVVFDGTNHPEWSKNATIYEINIRQHTPEGTFAAAQADLERIREMGIDILWVMPIFPIGEENRKGELGSYYSVKDYKGINPEFGTHDDFRAFVDRAHELGMKVILDWVANHSAWDNAWVENHPEYYETDSTGALVSPWDWTDVVAFDNDNPGMRAAMTDALKYWVSDYDVDGYRCDVAFMVPTDYWIEARTALDSIKPVFMLAEAEVPELHQAFDMSYSWEFLHVINGIAKGEKSLAALDSLMMKEDTNFSEHAYRMYFTTNHDENSWNKTVFERYGEKGHALYAALAFTIDGMPLVYSGQEAANRKELAFFAKDTIDWNGYELQDFYSTLLDLNRSNKALWNGVHGGSFTRLDAKNENVYAYKREHGSSAVIFYGNFSEEEVQASTLDMGDRLDYNIVYSSNGMMLSDVGSIELGPHDFIVLAK